MRNLFICIILLIFSLNAISLDSTIPESIKIRKIQVTSILCELHRRSKGVYSRKECGVWGYEDGSCDFWQAKVSTIKKIVPSNPPNPNKKLIFSAHTHPIFMSSQPSRNDKIFLNKYEDKFGCKVHNTIPMIILHPLYGATLYNPLSVNKCETFIKGESFRDIYKIWSNQNLYICKL